MTKHRKLSAPQRARQSNQIIKARGSEQFGAFGSEQVAAVVIVLVFGFCAVGYFGVAVDEAVEAIFRLVRAVY
jgi:hypothetical protein